MSELAGASLGLPCVHVDRCVCVCAVCAVCTAVV